MGNVLGALKVVGKWVLNNPNIAFDAVDKVAKIQADKKSISDVERLQTVEEKLNQLGAAALELEQRIDTETVLVRKQLYNMKIMLSVIGAALVLAIISIILLAIL